MATNKHGGKREGAGRPVKFSASLGNYLILEREAIGGEIQPPLLVKVVGVDSESLEVQYGNEIITLRFPDDGELVIKS